jgi:hypothetical protein
MLTHVSRKLCRSSLKSFNFSKAPISPRTYASSAVLTVHVQVRLHIRFCSSDFRHKMARSDRDVLPDKYAQTTDCSGTVLTLISVKPLNYNLSLFDLEFGGGWSYNGTVKIDAAVKKASKEIVVNSKELEIKGASLQSAESKCPSTRHTDLRSEREQKLTDITRLQQQNGRLPRSISTPPTSERPLLLPTRYLPSRKQS